MSTERLIAFLSHIQIRLLLMSQKTQREPVAGIGSRIKRFFKMESGWKNVPEISHVEVITLMDLAHHVDVASIPENLIYAAESFIEHKGDPEWIDYSGCCSTGKNAMKNSRERNNAQMNKLMMKDTTSFLTH